jgi:IBR domain, a half RING-finger domain
MKASKTSNTTDYWPRLPIQECKVCATQLLRTVNTPWHRITSDCAHRSTICLTYLQQHTQNQLEMNSWDQISCPVCDATLSPDDIQAWCAPAFFDRYGRISVRQAVHDGLSFCWCIGPECRNGFLCDPNKESYVTCNACERVTCLGCNVEYHEGVSCKEFQEEAARAEQRELAKQERHKQDQQSTAEVLRVSVRCPGKDCGAPIQKLKGCDHMTCQFAQGIHEEKLLISFRYPVQGRILLSMQSFA